MYGTDVETLIKLNQDRYPGLAEQPIQFKPGWMLRVPTGLPPIVIIRPATTPQVMPTRDANSGWFDQNLEVTLIKLINEERKKENLKPFVADEALSKIAHRRALEISFKFTHEGLETVCPKCGENLGWGGANATASDTLKAWMESESHRRNVLFPYSIQIGIGAYHINGRTYFTLEIKQELR